MTRTIEQINREGEGKFLSMQDETRDTFDRKPGFSPRISTLLILSAGLALAFFAGRFFP